jgi:pimeloyl-ACP methyl ester carboxylesterase
VSDFRQYLEALEKAGQLVHVTREVSPKFEVAAYVRKSSDTDGPVFVFENVKGHSGWRLAAGLYGTAPRLRELSVPTLLIVGEHDEPCVKVHRFMADTIPSARHVLIPGVGHLTNLEAPDAFNRAVTTFLREAARRTRATKRRARSGAARPGRRRQTG